MIRKLIPQKKSLTLTLPKKWIDSNNLKAGDEIRIEDLEKGLIINSEKKNKEKQKITLDLKSQIESSLRIRINIAYRKGYDIIKLKVNSKKQIDIVKELVSKHLLGIEIVEESEGLLVLENITEPSSEKQDVIMRRIFLIIKESLNTLEEDLKNKKLNSYKEILELTQKVDKYYYFCQRNLYKENHEKLHEHFYWTIYDRLQLVQRSILHIYEEIKTISASKEVLNILEIIKNEFYNIYEGFFKKDLEKVILGNEKLKTILYSNVFSSIKKSKKEETILLYYLGELSRLIYLITPSIEGLLIQ